MAGRLRAVLRRRPAAHHGQTVREDALATDHDLWIVSLDLAAVNPAVQEAIHPDRAGWDAVVFDEAHRLTPTAAGVLPGRAAARAEHARARC